MKKALAIILFLTGLLLLSSKFILSNSISRNNEKLIKEFEKIDISKNVIENKNEDLFEFDDIEYITPTKTFLSLDKIDKNSIIGQIVMPTIDTNLVIFNGISEAKLLAGVSTMKSGQEMGKGNYSIAGHYGIKDELFHNIEKLKDGDIVKITDKENIYYYEINDREIVYPNRVDLIEDREENKEEPIISLMCCYYENGKNSGKRLFVRGKLVDVKPYTIDEMEAK